MRYKLFFPASLLMCLFLFSCSNSEVKKDSEGTDTGSTDTVQADSAASNDLFADSSSNSPPPAEEPVTKKDEAAHEATQPTVDSPAAPEVAAESAVGAVGTYTVEGNETLMLIAFKIYGDYAKWKEIKKMNPGLDYNSMKVGEKIKYPVPAVAFVWNPSGNPYLINRGDTHGLISKDVYKTEKRWQEIFANNKPMIKKPDLIFAGFTLYYIPDRQLASEKQ